MRIEQLWEQAENERFFGLGDGELAEAFWHGFRSVFLRSFWFTADGEPHNSESVKGNYYYGRSETRELFWYHDCLLGSLDFWMQRSALNDLDLMWNGQTEEGNVPRGFGPTSPDFHYDTLGWEHDTRFTYGYTWPFFNGKHEPLDNTPCHLITTAQAYHATGDRGILERHRERMLRALSFMSSVTGDDLYGSRWPGHQSVDWREQVLDPDGRLLEAQAINGCTTYNQAVFHRALVSLSETEAIMGDAGKARELRELAARVKKRSNRPCSEGGLWDPANGCYVSWRGLDEAAHGTWNEPTFDPVAQVWAAYWGLADAGHLQRIVRLLTESFDQFVTPHGYVMASRDGGYEGFWDGWYFGGYAAVVLARAGRTKHAADVTRRMILNFPRPDQPVEHETIDGTSHGQRWNVVPVMNGLRAIKEGILGIRVAPGCLEVKPLIPGAGWMTLGYQGKRIKIVKQGEGPAVRNAELNGEPLDLVSQGVRLSSGILGADNELRLSCD